MTDEFTRRLLAKRNPEAAMLAAYEARKAADPLLRAASETIKARVAQLEPVGLAIIDLLNAIAEHAARMAPHLREQTQFSLMLTASRLLGVSDRDMALCTCRLHGADGAGFPSTFSFNDMLGGDAKQ